ncbi:response regulator [Limimaricola sp. G21655-S1]|uniref:response regulator n=1 Tax=Limimaricola sp. G21655-S1 TaxID=3014768 RepID=UPI0022AED59C|nr:response regulator [Limimaricola sp. G21655-S1]MCZ4262968.1 response regulator [Limimaricola sp. G21655-S1]
MRILIVEDEVFIALDLEMQLMDLGHEVVGIAACRATAIELARAQAPDLALVDLHLARQTSGAEAAAVMRADLGIPSIIVSGSLHELTEVDIAAIAPVAMLGKPFSPVKLHAAVQRVAQNATLRAEGTE